MSPDEFDALFDRFRRSAFRLETLPAYLVDEEAARIAAFKAGEARPERSVRTNPWLARIAWTTVADGKDWRRIRVLDDPLTDYQQYQLPGYLESQACGDQVRIIGRDDIPGESDYWLFDASDSGDGASAVILSYDPAGRFLGFDPVPAPGEVARLSAFALRCWEYARPLNHYLACEALSH